MYNFYVELTLFMPPM